MIEISPSLLAANFSKLSEELKKVENATYLHLDVMDGAFVPNITFGPGLISDIRSKSDLLFDTHLMIENPEKYIKSFAEAGSDLITIHVEATNHLHRLIQKIKDLNCRAGVALNPATSIDSIHYVLDDLDLILIMSVNPGFGGQKFIKSSLDKIRHLKDLKMQKAYNYKISVDGGIKLNNVKEVINAGADVIVAGSAIFKSENPTTTLNEFINVVNK